VKTLVSTTETSATYEFTHGTARRSVTYDRPEEATENPDFERMATAEHLKWLSWLGVTE